MLENPHGRYTKSNKIRSKKLQSTKKIGMDRRNMDYV